MFDTYSKYAIVLVVMVALVAGMNFSYLAPGREPGNSPTGQAASAPHTEKLVEIMSFAFEPTELAIKTGTTLVWANRDSSPHTVTGDGFQSGTLQPGQTFSHTFDRPGVFTYSCSINPELWGKVSVS